MSVIESFPVVKVEIGFEVLQLLYIGCVTLITLWNCGLYSNTVKIKLRYSCSANKHNIFWPENLIIVFLFLNLSIISLQSCFQSQF